MLHQHNSTTYDPVLDTSKHITQDERRQLALARNFTQGYTNDDDEVLLAIANAIQNRNLFIFSVQEQQRLTLAMRRHAALVRFQQAWRDSYRNAQRLVDAYDASLLDASKKLVPEQRARVYAARNYMKMR